MSNTPSRDVIAQRLQVLLSGGGYNFYGRADTARADDLLVRGQASASLGQAGASLRAMEAEYARRFVPPSTRENPYPPGEVLEKLRAIGRLRERIGALETDIRGMAVPAQDKVWWRFRQEAALLQDLLAHDHGLLLHTDEVARLAQAVTADAWQGGGAVDTPLIAALQQLDAVVRDRHRLLSQP